MELGPIVLNKRYCSSLIAGALEQQGGISSSPRGHQNVSRPIKRLHSDAVGIFGAAHQQVPTYLDLAPNVQRAPQLGVPSEGLHTAHGTQHRAWSQSMALSMERVICAGTRAMHRAKGTCTGLHMGGDDD